MPVVRRVLRGQKKASIFVRTDSLSSLLDWMVVTSPKNKLSAVRKGCEWIREHVLGDLPAPVAP
jgi:hypothetical protein